MLETVITENMTEMQSLRARMRVKPNMEMISDSVTITDTMGDEVLAIDGDGVRYDDDKDETHHNVNHCSSKIVN